MYSFPRQKWLHAAHERELAMAARAYKQAAAQPVLIRAAIFLRTKTPMDFTSS